MNKTQVKTHEKGREQKTTKTFRRETADELFECV